METNRLSLLKRSLGNKDLNDLVTIWWPCVTHLQCLFQCVFHLVCCTTRKVMPGSIGSSGWVGGGGGARNMKSMWPPLAAIFFMTYFYRAWGGAWPPRHPPGSATVPNNNDKSKQTLTNQQWCSPYLEVNTISYLPQTKFGTRYCFYTCLSAILFTMGGPVYTPRQTPPGQTPPNRHTPWADTPRQTPTPLPDGNWSGRYASYWNAFLCNSLIVLHSFE